MIWFILCLLIGILPAVMIANSIFISIIIVTIQQLFPLTSVIFWIWGLICAIGGKQDIWAYIYYVAFVVLFGPYFIKHILDFIQRRK